jgi:DNA invertase Pin-like site-specific DNA recombinase
MTYYLYARVSTDDKGQDPETQLLPLRAAYPGAPEHVELASAVGKRPAWDLLLTHLVQPGDVIVVWKFDRAFRDVGDAVVTLSRLRARGIRLVSLTEPTIEMDTAVGRLFTNIIAAFGQYERDLLSERTKAGMARVAATGKHMGRPKKKVA